ncbi:hypothetical protein Sru01_16480 [Sphaerisporangium rufum]|uniref:Uncharacterized protein n=1 Tax=Sphaerisporangium rufum TaxID=1381558 RepID=A0A919R1G7_9ACTN|nr:hypothetical protein [Sphaerisporangium rufum]GII76666.1 hypothetical protein Sru01_16480 [Sphaerisporangium rufum]
MNFAAASHPVAFSAYYSLVFPAMRDAARVPLRRARHNGAPCGGIDRRYLCDDCVSDIHDRMLAGYERLGRATDGRPPRTRTGETVHEMEPAVRWMTSLVADPAGWERSIRRLRNRPVDGEPAGLRAARAQLVYYPLQKLEAETRRADAISRGGAAHPRRDLTASRWATPLRENPAALDLLIDAIERLRCGATDPYAIPRRLLDQYDLDLPAAWQLLRAAFDRLRAVRRDFYIANVAVHIDKDAATGDLINPPQTPEELLIEAEDQSDARHAVTKLIQGSEGTVYRALLTRICAADTRGGEGVVPWTARTFSYDEAKAATFVRAHVHLAVQAGLDWTETQTSATPRRRTSRPEPAACEPS